MTNSVDEVHSLLAVIADPAKHKQRLDELVELQKTVDEKIAALNEMAGDTRRLNSAAEAATIVSNNRRSALDSRESEIRTRENQLAADVAEHSKARQQFSAQIKQREAAAAIKETSVIERENALGKREQAAKRETDRLAALKSEYEAKIKKLRELAI